MISLKFILPDPAGDYQVQFSMDLPVVNVEHMPEKFEDVKDSNPKFHCSLSDAEVVHKIAQALLPGLATACVDNTTGDLFKSPASVAVDLRKEMVDYLTQRSENFVAESVILEGSPVDEASDHPYDIISDFIDEFAYSKRNFFTRISEWLLSDKREDRIDDFIQEMEVTGFWSIDRRQRIAQTLIENVDLKKIFHCNMKLDTEEELNEHVILCGFRSLNCTNEGCNAGFCAAQVEKHDSVCPFKIIPCEQNCSDSIMRREMDRHCITNCSMKLINCPFYSLGCQSGVPQCMIEQHRSKELDAHLMYILQVIHKEASMEDLEPRVEQLKKLSSPTQLADARDVRSLSSLLKVLDEKLGPLKERDTNKIVEEGGPNISNLAGEAKDGLVEVGIRNEVTQGSTEDVNLCATSN